MSDKNNPNLLPGADEPVPIEAGEGREILEGMAGLTALAVSGFVAFVTMVSPARVKGATCSARLQWQQRQKEIVQTIEATCSTATSAPARNPKSAPDGAP